MILTLCGLFTVGCVGPRPPFHPVKDDLTKNTYEVYVSEQSYGEVVNRLRGLVDKQKWLSWMSRSTDCQERPALKPGQWAFACGGRGPWWDWCTPANPYHVYSKWGLVDTRGSGVTIRLTEPVTPIFYRNHPNTEIFEKAGIHASFKRKEPYK